jgi:hypothetical protein
MKPLHIRPLILALPLAITSFLASCVTDDYQSSGDNASSSGRYMTYASLPSDYSGDAYYYNNRYYAGGRYEPGTYTHEGRRYNDRYFHNGQYIYGGDYRQSASPVSYRDSSFRPSTSTNYTTYRTLPSNYSGDAYYYNDRYYIGGRYEPGTYSYQGQSYDHRYFHDGQYFYGGDYRQSPTVVSTRTTLQPSSPAYSTSRR